MRRHDIAYYIVRKWGKPEKLSKNMYLSRKALSSFSFFFERLILRFSSKFSYMLFSIGLVRSVKVDRVNVLGQILHLFFELKENKILEV